MKKVYKEVTVKDLIAHVSKGKTLIAGFAVYTSKGWVECPIVGLRVNKEYNPFIAAPFREEVCWTRCAEVVLAPDPEKHVMELKKSNYLKGAPPRNIIMKGGHMMHISGKELDFSQLPDGDYFLIPREHYTAVLDDAYILRATGGCIG